MRKIWRHTPFLVVISAPSGTGKTTICRMLVERDENLAYSVSATTRRKRKEEVDGRDYHFLGREKFEKWITERKLVEWSEVYGELYGTPIEPIKRYLGQGKDVLLDLDLRGKISLEKEFPGRVVSLFLIPPDLEELKERLEKRGVESPEKLEVRMEKMREELGWAIHYDYWVLNDKRELAEERVYSIVEAERMRRERLDLRILRSLKARIPPQ